MNQLGEVYGRILLCIGPCLLAFSVVSAVRTKRFVHHSAEVTGEVIRLKHTTDGLGSTSYQSYAPVFSFTAADEKTHTVTSDISSSPAAFSVGESVRVRYDPDDPQDARIHSFFETWGAAAISGAVGVGFVIFGCKLLGVVELLR